MTTNTNSAHGRTASIDLDKDAIRAVFMKHGFTIKEGQTDLKPYVYAAAEELIALARRAQQPATAIQATSGAPAESPLDADEMTRLRRLMKALGMDGSFNAPDSYVRGILCAVLGQAARWIERAGVHDAAAPSAEQAPYRMPEGVKNQIENLEWKVRNLERAHEMRKLHEAGDVWYWQGDGADNLNSMSMGMIVVIRADSLRDLVSAGAAAKTEHASYCENNGCTGCTDPDDLAAEVRATAAGAGSAQQAAPEAPPSPWFDSAMDTGIIPSAVATASVGEDECETCNGVGYFLDEAGEVIADCPDCKGRAPASSRDAGQEEASTQAVPSIDTPEFNDLIVQLLDADHAEREGRENEYLRIRRKLIAYIDGRTAGTAGGDK